jgi:hypothetical protein
MPTSLQILFIGNSFTNRNNLPGMLARLAESSTPPITIKARLIIANGMALKRHWTRGEAREAIGSQPWDYVVLQEQSTLPLKNRARMHESITLFANEIIEAGAKPVLYMTWARLNAQDRQDELSDAYLEIGRTLGAKVVPAGMAWHSALKRMPGLVLHEKDGSHPNPLGTYLAACVFYVSLFGKSPVGLAVDPAVSGKFEAEVIKQIQQIAWSMVKDQKRAATSSSIAP